MRCNDSRNFVRMCQWLFVDKSPFGASPCEGSGHMEVNVWNRLVGRNSVVLPHRDSWPTVGYVDRSCSRSNTYCERSKLRVSEVQNRFTVSGRHNQEMRESVNRPGFDGGSGYWISTRVWSVRFVA